MTTKRKAKVSVACKFTGVSIGEDTARIGVQISRDGMTLDEADGYFVGRRLSGRIEVLGEDEDPKQKRLLADARPAIEGTFDVKRVGVDRKKFSTGLTFALADIAIEQLGHFAKRTGRMLIDNVDVLEDDKPDDEEGEEDEEEEDAEE